MSLMISSILASSYFFGSIVIGLNIAFIVKFSRQNGIHVSPTVLWDGLKQDQISSSWLEKEWTEFFEAKIVI
jgi:hypothetical protein